MNNKEDDLFQGYGVRIELPDPKFFKNKGNIN